MTRAFGGLGDEIPIVSFREDGGVIVYIKDTLCALCTRNSNATIADVVPFNRKSIRFDNYGREISATYTARPFFPFLLFFSPWPRNSRPSFR